MKTGINGAITSLRKNIPPSCQSPLRIARTARTALTARNARTVVDALTALTVVTALTARAARIAIITKIMVKNKNTLGGIMLKLLFLLSVLIVSVNAYFIDFEDGEDGYQLTDIPGVEFKDMHGYEPMYGDSRTGEYNTYSDDLEYGFYNCDYHHKGNIFVWSGFNGDATGLIIDFGYDNSTWFQTGYSCLHDFYIDAYMTDGSIIIEQGKPVINDSMEVLFVLAPEGKYIDYVEVHGEKGDFWIIDDISGDAAGIGDPSGVGTPPRPGQLPGTPTSVPEPSVVSMVAIGCITMVTKLWRKKKPK